MTRPRSHLLSHSDPASSSKTYKFGVAITERASYGHREVVTFVNKCQRDRSRMDCESSTSDVAITGDRWQIMESAFNDLTFSDCPAGGCTDVEVHPVSGRLTLTANLNPLESRSSFSLVARLIASITPLDEVGARARVLLKHYSDLRGLIRAATSDISQSEILTDTERVVLRTVRDVSESYLRECSSRSSRIRTFSELHSYLKVSLATEQREVTRLLMLDKDYNLIADELHGFGKLNQTHFFPKEVIARTVAHNAAAIIIVHSHPSGEPDPSKDDVLLTKRLAFVLEHLSVSLHDHVIIGQRVVVSLRRLGILGEDG